MIVFGKKPTISRLKVIKQGIDVIRVSCTMYSGWMDPAYVGWVRAIEAQLTQMVAQENT